MSCKQNRKQTNKKPTGLSLARCGPVPGDQASQTGACCISASGQCIDRTILHGCPVVEFLFEFCSPAECYSHASQTKYISSRLNGPGFPSVGRLAEVPVLSNTSWWAHTSKAEKRYPLDVSFWGMSIGLSETVIWSLRVFHFTWDDKTLHLY